MVSFFLFGKKKRIVKKKSTKKPSVLICKMCKRLKIKITKKIGGRRVYKSVTVLKKQIKRKMKKIKKIKKKKVTRFGFSFGSVNKRRSRFGSGAPFNNNTVGYDFNKPVVQYPGTLAQTSQVITSSTNAIRPSSMQLKDNSSDIYGVNRMFFNESVPTQVPPNWNFMGQPDGSAYPAGAPFYGYKTPFGRYKSTRRRRKF